MKKGFTLAELLGVTVLLSLLVVISYPILFNSFDEQKQELDKSKLQLIYNASENYIKMNRNIYPYYKNNEVCIFLKDLIDEDLIAVELDREYETRIVKVKMLENNQFSTTLLEEGKTCKSSDATYYVKKCNERNKSNSNYELVDNKVQYIIDNEIVRQIDYIEGKNLNKESSSSYDVMSNNYSNLYEMLRYRKEYYSRLNKGKDYFSMIIDTNFTINDYNPFTDNEVTILNNTPIFYNGSGVDKSCD